MLLKVDNLRKYFTIPGGGNVKAVDDVSLQIGENEVLGLVGESGCGKTTVGRCILRLIEPTSGKVEFQGKDFLALKGEELRKERKNIQIVFQDPLSALNPRMTIRSIVGEPLIIHGIAKGREREEKVAALLEDVGLNGSHLNRYPHEFSGGQRQRIGIARALALRPKLIVADEPVSALDVSVQAQIINLLEELKATHSLSYLFVAHNIAVVKHISDRIAVMYLGRIVEIGTSDEICSSPLHPYTQALLAAVPVPDPETARGKGRTVIQGDIPSPTNPPSGCPFHPRCPMAKKICSENVPALEVKKDGRLVSCFFA
ncbi:MAG: ATP-binding cassette domain-containing protein [Fibrobacteres bacterium]|nr:ATP-binding cassette domain-containing protein [Fibrobacterota bacterium]